MIFTVVSVAEDYVSSLTIINYSIDGERFEKSVIYYQYSGNTIVGANKVTVHALADIFEVCPEDRDTFINSFTYSQKTDRIHTMRKKGENDRIERFTDYKYTYNEYGQLIEIGYQFYLKENDGYYHPHEDEVLLNMRWSEGNMYFCDRIDLGSLFLFSQKDIYKNERMFVVFPRFRACKNTNMVL